jgi:CRISPR-associated protein Cas2
VLRKKRYIIAYDIVDDRKRARAADTLKDYGLRIQKSVFECNLKEPDRDELIKKLKAIIDANEDSALIIPLCGTCLTETQTIGLAIKRIEEDFQIL